MDKRIADALYIIVIVILFATLIYGYQFINSETKLCVEQPFIYGAKKTAGDTFCNCYSITEDERLQFKFNDTWFEATRTDWSEPFG